MKTTKKPFDYLAKRQEMNDIFEKNRPKCKSCGKSYNIDKCGNRGTINPTFNSWMAH